jgi:phenylpropionate dioxygenase-like ring-hydroxylating dioxygenase large terminal subunit
VTESKTEFGDGETQAAEELSAPVTIGVNAYISPEYARAERDKLWRKVWQQVGRVEELPEVGSYLTYDILDDSIIVVRTGADEFKAHHNVCMHRGRRLVDTPHGAKNACGRARKSFVCGFHGWTYSLDGACIHVPERQDWQDALTPHNTHLGEVNVDSWGGWIWINMDPDCEPLPDYLEPAAGMLEPFGLQNMRCKWRKWLHFECNWKVAMEAFNETYHVVTTHPQFNKFGEFRGWARAQGKHSNIGYDAPEDMEETRSKIRLGTGTDARISTAEMQLYTLQETNATTTQTLVDAALRLVDELPEDTPPDKVLEHWLSSARRDDAARGVIWPTIDPDVLGKSGTAWQIFPNFQIGQGLTSALCYSARPYGYDPDKCIFEVAVYELFPKGEEPQTEWEYSPADDPRWLSVLPQDFSNMAAVQQGMKSFAFPGTKPNPYRERSTANLHRQLAKYMGTGEPQELKTEQREAHT